MFGAMFGAIGVCPVRLDDFRENGMLLPANEMAAARSRLPLHRGPHRQYSVMVAERVSQVELRWLATRRREPAQAACDARQQLALLQRALRLQLLLAQPYPIVRNRKDPLRAGRDFAQLDDMAEKLWSATDISSPSD